jgi:hypothetical protein
MGLRGGVFMFEILRSEGCFANSSALSGLQAIEHNGDHVWRWILSIAKLGQGQIMG